MKYVKPKSFVLLGKYVYFAPLSTLNYNMSEIHSINIKKHEVRTLVPNTGQEYAFGFLQTFETFLKIGVVVSKF